MVRINNQKSYVIEDQACTYMYMYMYVRLNGVCTQDQLSRDQLLHEQLFIKPIVTRSTVYKSTQLLKSTVW